LLRFVIVTVGVGWFMLRPVWQRRNATTKTRLERTLAGIVAGGLVVLAFEAVTAKDHYVCTDEAPTRDGTECVGDYVREAGPNYGGAFICTLLAMVAFRVSVNEGDKPDPANAPTSAA
jgi:hypothetical protein